jgi:putative tryptophan/tyrosine transport system substrate-binding protein
MNAFPSKSLSDNRKSAIQNPKWLGLSVIAFVLVVVGGVAQAQQPTKLPRIGYVSGTGNTNTPGPLVEVFRQGLRDLGYIEDKSITVEYRFSDGNPVHEAELARELVRLNLDVIVIGPLPAIRAAKEATKTIPIVMVTTQNPVATGLVDSLARPGGNITGVTRLTRELSEKRLELLKDLVPSASRVGILLTADSQNAGISFKGYETAARALKLQLQALEVRGPNPDFPAAFAAAGKGRVSAIVTVTTALIGRYSKRIADLATKNRLPSMFERTDYVEAGGLASYSSNEPESFRRAAVFVDKILKGAKPAEMPVEQPTQFEFVINLKTAKQIGLTIPPNVLARADKVIK